MTNTSNESRFSKKLDRVVQIMELLSSNRTWWHFRDIHKRIDTAASILTVQRDCEQLLNMSILEKDSTTLNFRWSYPTVFIRKS